MKTILSLACCLSALACHAAVAAAVPPAAGAAPVLVLDAGRHTAPVRRIAVSSDGRLVATASDDKTAALWRADTGERLHVLRALPGPGGEGRLYGAAFHPHEPLLVVGGTGSAEAGAVIQWHATDSGELLRVVAAGRGEVKRLAWSADGRWLLAAFAAPGAVRVFAADGRLAFEMPLAGDGYGLDVHAGGQVVATDTAGTAHLFTLGADGRPLAQRQLAVGGMPVASAFAPAVGAAPAWAVVHFDAERQGSVTVFELAADGRGAPVTWRATGLGRGRTQAVAWSHDRTRLAIGGVHVPGGVAGRLAIDALRGYIQEFDTRTGAPAALHEVASDAVTDLRAAAAGGWAFSSFDGHAGMVAAAGLGGLVRLVGAAQPSGQGSASGVVPAEGPGLRAVRRPDRLWLAGPRVVQWQGDTAVGPWRFDLAERVLRTGAAAGARAPEEPGLLAAATRDWDSVAQAVPVIQGARMPLDVGEISRAVARIPGSDDVAWGTGHRLARVAPGGRVVWSIRPGTETRAVHGGADGAHVVAAMSDGTLRWYRARDGALLLSLFVLDPRRWVLWTPGGYYDASAGAEPLLGWVLPEGGAVVAAAPGAAAQGGAATRAPVHLTSGRFRERFHRPDVVDRVLDDGDEALALERADRARAQALRAEAAPPASPVTTAPPATPTSMAPPATPASVVPPAPPALPVPAAQAQAPATPAASGALAATAASATPATPAIPATPATPATQATQATPAVPGASAAASAAPDRPETLPPMLAHKQSPAVLTAGSTVTLAFAVRSDARRPVTALVVRRDGVLQEAADVRWPPAATPDAPARVTLPVPPGESVVHVAAANANGFSDALTFKVLRTAPPLADSAPAVPSVPALPAAPGLSAPAPDDRPRLFALLVGVGRYADPQVNPLDLPGKDATDLARVLAAQAGRAYSAVHTRVLTDEQATRAAIVGGLEWLARSVGPRDFGVLFIAGHALNHGNGQYYFLGHDVVVDRLAATAVAQTQIRATLARLRGRAVLFVDTCHAGNVFGAGRAPGPAPAPSRDLARLANELASPENGVIVFASSTGRQLSLESREWGNGAFTRALVAGLNGGADLMGRGRVTFQGLGYYVSAEVEKLTGGRQTPVVIAPPPGLPDFTLALLQRERLGGLGPDRGARAAWRGPARLAAAAAATGAAGTAAPRQGAAAGGRP